MPVFPVVDVTDFRIAEDADDTASIGRAVDFALAAGVGVIYFPPGEYLVGGDPRGLALAGFSGLTFLGDGDCSVLRRVDLADPEDLESSSGMLDFSVCRDITIARLSMDANGLQPARDAQDPQIRALVSFEACERVRVEDVKVFDSSPRSVGEPDDFIALDRISHHFDSAQHVAFGFHGGTDLFVEDNRLSGSGIAVHGGASRVRIARNVILAPLGHGIAVGSSRPDEGVTSGVDILDNLVEDPLVFGIVAADVRPSPREGEPPDPFVGSGFRRVRIRGNTILKRNGQKYVRAIVAGRLEGTLPEGGEDPVAPYEAFTVANNVIDIATAQPREQVADDVGRTFAWEVSRVAGIWMELPQPGFAAAFNEADDSVTIENAPKFERAVVTGNAIHGATYGVPDGGGVAIQCANLVRAVVGGNGISSSDDGLALVLGSLGTHVHDNRAAVFRDAYACDRSVRDDHFDGNATSGEVTTRWRITLGTPARAGGDE